MEEALDLSVDRLLMTTMMYMYVYIYIYIHTHTCVYIYTHTCIYIHTHTHTHTRSSTSFPRASDLKMPPFSPPFFFISFFTLPLQYFIIFFILFFLSTLSLSLSLSLYCNFRPCGYLLLVLVCTVGGNLCHCLTVQSTQRSIDQTCLQVLLQDECLPLLLIDNSLLSSN